MAGGPSATRVYVPGYIKSDGTVVNGYWRDNTATRRLPGLKGGKTFRSGTFRVPKRR
jgi:hypothetical protein